MFLFANHLGTCYLLMLPLQESPAVKQASGPEPLLPSLLFFAGGSRGVYRGGTVIRVHLERNHRSLRGRKCSFSIRLARYLTVPSFVPNFSPAIFRKSTFPPRENLLPPPSSLHFLRRFSSMKYLALWNAWLSKECS